MGFMRRIGRKQDKDTDLANLDRTAADISAQLAGRDGRTAGERALSSLVPMAIDLLRAPQDDHGGVPACPEGVRHGRRGGPGSGCTGR
jgi:hypothetical protein